MDERRKKDRTDLEAQLRIKRLDGTKIEEADVTVTDVSITGIGFTCAEQLEMGSVYQGKLTLWTKEQLQVFLEIIRVKEKDGIYNYGAVFIGMSEFLTNRIGAYQVVERESRKE